MRPFFCFVFVCLCLQTARADTSYQVLTSIRPLALITQDVLAAAGLEDQVQVSVLLKPGQSAHHHALKLSDMRQLNSADLVIWVGHEMEHFLEKAIQQRKGQSLEFASLVTPENNDPHLWLNSRFAVHLAEHIAAHLNQTFPGPELNRAAARFKHQVEQTRLTLQGQFQGLNTQPGVLLYHDSLGYFLNDFGIAKVATLTQVAEQQISARHLLSVKQSSEGQCLLADLDEAEMARGYASKLESKAVIVDLLASDRSVSTYSNYLQTLALQIQTCFQAK